MTSGSGTAVLFLYQDLSQPHARRHHNLTGRLWLAGAMLLPVPTNHQLHILWPGPRSGDWCNPVLRMKLLREPQMNRTWKKPYSKLFKLSLHQAFRRCLYYLKLAGSTVVPFTFSLGGISQPKGHGTASLRRRLTTKICRYCTILYHTVSFCCVSVPNLCSCDSIRTFKNYTNYTKPQESPAPKFNLKHLKT